MLNRGSLYSVYCREQLIKKYRQDLQDGNFAPGALDLPQMAKLWSEQWHANKPEEQARLSAWQDEMEERDWHPTNVRSLLLSQPLPKRPKNMYNKFVNGLKQNIEDLHTPAEIAAMKPIERAQASQSIFRFVVYIHLFVCGW